MARLRKHIFISACIALLFCIVSLPSHAQLKINPVFEKSVEDSIPAHILKEPRKRIVTLSVENDSLGGDSDRHYTSGVRLSYYDINAAFPEFAHKIADAVPTFDINQTTSLIYSIGQSLYTPADISRRDWDDTQRPWAAYNYFSLAMASLNDNRVDEIEATIGIVGPSAYGEQTQSFVHDLIGSRDPSGWDNQLSDEPGGFLSWQRRFLEVGTLQTSFLYASLDPFFGVTLGNVYTHASTGLSFRLGPPDTRWHDIPLRVRPSMPGTGYYSIPQNKLSWNIFGGVEGRAIARNIFLDGNTFKDSPRVDKKYFVGDLNLGFSLTYGQARVSYTLAWRSEEFQGQDEPDVFGSLGLSFRF